MTSSEPQLEFYKDRDQVLNVLDEIGTNSSDDEFAHGARDAKDFLQQALTDEKYAREIFVTIAKIRGSIVGYIAGFISLEDETLADVYSHSTQVDHRRQGIAKKLHKLTRNNLIALGIKRVKTVVPTDSGIGFVEAVGYKNAVIGNGEVDPSDYLLEISS